MCMYIYTRTSTESLVRFVSWVRLALECLERRCVGAIPAYVNCVRSGTGTQNVSGGTWYLRDSLGTHVRGEVEILYVHG